jgi:DNA-binding NarL/FixJ family response regulator
MKILLLDDHKVILNLVGDFLSNNLNAEVIKVSSIEEFNKNATNIDLFIIDLSLEDGSGFDVLDILSKSKEKNVIIYTSNTDPGIIRHLLKLKLVRSVVHKSSNEDELLMAVKSVMKGQEFICKKTSLIINTTKRSYLDLEDNDTELTHREREIVNLMWNNLSSQEIADKLFLSINTVENHRKNIKRKLGADSVISILKISLKKGYINTLMD